MGQNFLFHSVGAVYAHNKLSYLLHPGSKASHVHGLADPPTFINIISAFVFSTIFLFIPVTFLSDSKRKHNLKALEVYGHMMDAFVHCPIDLSQTAIRLARLFGGYYPDPIRCEIFEAFLDLSEIIPYKALSYVWGDESEKKEICINKKRAFVTSNLFKALKSLRQIDKDTILWVDAMCIDQSNNKEKGHQVSQMRLVYERAEEVIIWLGESDADIEMLFDCASKLDKAVGKIRAQKTTYDAWKTVWKEKEKERVRFDASSETRYAGRRSSALQRLLGRSWFKRIWVIQEAASAKRATVRCGLNTVPTRTFAMLPQLMGEEVDARVHAVLEVMPGPSRSTSSWWHASRDLETLLKKFGRSESSNPLDTIYALLGISSNFKDNRVLSPDYDITFEKAIENTIWALLFGEGLNRNLYKLPTWDKTQFLDSLKDLPGSVFDWAISEKEAPVLVHLLTCGDISNGVQAPNLIKEYLHHKRPLHALVQNDGPLSTIQAFMPHADLDINRMSDVHDGNGPLHLAAKMGLESIVGILLQHPKVDVNLGGYGSIVKRMVQATKHYSNFVTNFPYFEAYWPDTPLNIAVSKGHSSVVELLLQYCNNGVRVKVKNSGRTALHLAALVLKGYPEDARVVKLLLQHENVDINGPIGKGWSPLNIAVIQENDRMTKLLLQHEGIDVNHIGEGSTPLESAVEAGSTSTTSMLIKDDRVDHGEVIRLIKRVVASSSCPDLHLRPPLDNQLPVLKELIKRVVPYSRPDPYLRPSLDDQLPVLKELLAGCSDQDGEVLGQALVRASEFGNLSLMRLLLDNGARTNGHGGPWFRHEPHDYQRNMTPLCAAVEKGSEAAIRLLLDHCAQPDDLDKNMSGDIINSSEKTKTPLGLAVRQGRQTIAEMLLRYGASVHHKNLHGTTPLLELFHQDSRVVRWRKTSLRGWNSGEGMKCPWDTHAVEQLSLHGANISSDAYRCRFVGWISYSRIKALISLRNASKWIFDEFVASEDRQIEDWLEIEIEHELETNSKSVDMAQRLLAHGADIEARDERGMTLLWMAVSRDHLQLVDLLLSFGADMEASDSIYGRTPLWVAALLDFDDMIHKLLGKGARREVRCKQGKTPLCIAAEKGCGKAVKALVDSQADLHAKDSQGRTPLDLARENGHGDFEGLLLSAK